MDFQSYINSELLILVPVLYLIGIGLKKSALNDKWIPAMLGGISVVLCTAWTIASTPLAGWQDLLLKLFTGVVQGVLVAGASVYVNQLVKQAGKEE